ncbi:MAG: hypothetical protein ACREE7_06035 [Dongiaceae bacterium]
MSIRIPGRLLPLAAFLAIGLAAIPARADYYDDGGEPFRKRKLDVKFGMLLGGFEIGPLDSMMAFGGDMRIGYKLFDRLHIEGSAALAGVQETTYMNPDPVGGLLERYGIGVKYHFATIGGGRYMPLMVRFYGAGEAGYQTVRWDKGGIVRRNDAGFGFGTDLDFRVSKSGPKTIGMYMDFRLIVARSPGDPGPAACQAICDEPTPPLSTDFMPLFRFGVSFGF